MTHYPRTCPRCGGKTFHLELAGYGDHPPRHAPVCQLAICTGCGRTLVQNISEAEFTVEHQEHEKVGS